MSKYIEAEKLIAKIKRLKSVLTDPLCSQGNILGPDWVAGGNKMLKEISSVIDSLQREAEKERIKEQKELNKIANQYRDYVIAQVEEKRALPSFKGQLLHDFKNEVNTMKQILGVLNWGDIQYALFEKFALVFATWGGYHFHPKEIESEDSLHQEQPEPFTCGHENGSEPKPEALHFTPLYRIIQKIQAGEWSTTVNNYARKLRDCLIKEGYRKDAEVLQGYISYMNGHNVPIATMDGQKQPEVELNEETIINEFRVIRDKCFNEGIEGWQREKLIARHFYELGLKARKEE